jgi:hypothetical protein
MPPLCARRARRQSLVVVEYHVALSRNDAVELKVERDLRARSVGGRFQRRSEIAVHLLVSSVTGYFASD